MLKVLFSLFSLVLLCDFSMQSGVMMFIHMYCLVFNDESGHALPSDLYCIFMALFMIIWKLFFLHGVLCN